jgi:hypothetical protein
MTGIQSELDAVPTEELIRYVVSAEEREAALAVLKKYADHPATAQLLRHYYTALPMGREEMAVEVRVAAQNQGHYLFALQTSQHDYLYIGSDQETLLVGELSDGLHDDVVLEFFGFSNPEEFLHRVTVDFEELAVPGDERAGSDLPTCVACGVNEGEHHLLGCPVELCPWCEAQLSRCNCRFDQLGVEQIDDEALLDSFAVLLEKKGRVPFHTSQNPAYPAAGEQPAGSDEAEPEG